MAFADKALGKGLRKVLKHKTGLITVLFISSTFLYGCDVTSAEDTPLDCDAMFSAFQEAQATRLSPKRWGGVLPRYLWRLDEAIDIDNDGRLERVFFFDFEGYGDGRAGLPYSKFAIVEDDDPAFESVDDDDLRNLFRQERTRAEAASSSHDFLSWDDFRFFDMGVKGHREPARDLWSREEVRAYFKNLGIEGPMSEYFGSGLPGNAISRVGRVDGQLMFYLKANLDPQVMGFDWIEEHTNEVNQYIGPKYEFLATYHDPETFDFLCARDVSPNE